MNGVDGVVRAYSQNAIGIVAEGSHAIDIAQEMVESPDDSSHDGLRMGDLDAFLGCILIRLAQAILDFIGCIFGLFYSSFMAYMVDGGLL